MNTGQQYFFIFTVGQYDDYRVGGLCVCDHQVADDEWEAHRDKYEVARRVKRDELICSGRADWYRELNNWKEENDPMVSFATLHSMRKIEYSEFHRDDD